MGHESIYICPECGKTMVRVIKTTTLKNGIVKRLRHCYYCGNDIITKEETKQILNKKSISECRGEKRGGTAAEKPPIFHEK